MKLNDLKFSKSEKKLIGRKLFFYQSIFNTLFRPYNPFYLQYTSKIVNGPNIDIVGNSSENLKISLASSPGLYIQALSKIKLHSSVLIGPRVTIISKNHKKNDFSSFAETSEVSVSIGKNVWLGANAVILPNVTISENCVIGAGSIVTRSIESGTIVAGNPAKAIGTC